MHYSLSKFFIEIICGKSEPLLADQKTIEPYERTVLKLKMKLTCEKISTVRAITLFIPSSIRTAKSLVLYRSY